MTFGISCQHRLLTRSYGNLPDLPASLIISEACFSGMTGLLPFGNGLLILPDEVYCSILARIGWMIERLMIYRVFRKLNSNKR